MNSDTSKLEKTLLGLIRRARSEFEKKLQAREIKSNTIIRQKRDVTSFKYREISNGVTICPRVEYSLPKDVPEQDWTDAIRIIEEELKTAAKEYQTVLSQLKKTKTQDPEFLLSHLISMALAQKDNTWKTTEYELVERFLNQIDSNTVKWIFQVGIIGLSLENEIDGIYENSSLRPYNEEDAQDAYGKFKIFLDGQILSFYNHPQVVLTIDTRFPNDIDKLQKGIDDFIKKKIERQISFLELFLGKPVRIKYWIAQPATLAEGVGVSWSDTRFGYLEPVHIDKSQQKPLEKLFLASSPVNDLPEQALKRYSDALNSADSILSVTNSAMGLDALFGESTESTYKLGNRVALFLSFLGYDPVGVRNDVVKAYGKVRSKFLHGEEVKVSSAELPELRQRIIEYLRRCLLVCILTDSKKGELIESLDDALLIEEKRQQLKDKFEPYKKFAVEKN